MLRLDRRKMCKMRESRRHVFCREGLGHYRFEARPGSQTGANGQTKRSQRTNKTEPTDKHITFGYNSFGRSAPYRRILYIHFRNPPQNTFPPRIPSPKQKREVGNICQTHLFGSTLDPTALQGKAHNAFLKLGVMRARHVLTLIQQGLDE